jgi:hypothetical protein
MRRRTTSAAEGRNERKRFHSLGGGEGGGRSFERALVTQDRPAKDYPDVENVTDLDKSHAFLGSWAKLLLRGVSWGPRGGGGGRGYPSASFQPPSESHQYSAVL